MNRMTLALALSIGLVACSKDPSEARQPLIPFSNDTHAGSIDVAVQGVDYRVPVFGRPESAPASREINVYLIPPPSRYKFDQQSRQFGYWNHYEHFPTASRIEGMAAHFSDDIPLVVMALPGTYGSPAPSALQHEYRAVEIMDRALDRLMAETGALRVNIAAQSTTAPIAAALTTRRNDLGCLALSSGPFDYPSLVAERGWPRMYSGAQTPFSMMSMVDAIQVAPRRTIILIADKNDRIVPFSYSARFSEALKQKGHAVRLVSLNTSDPMHHALQYEAIREMIACQQAAGNPA